MARTLLCCHKLSGYRGDHRHLSLSVRTTADSLGVDLYPGWGHRESLLGHAVDRVRRVHSKRGPEMCHLTRVVKKQPTAKVFENQVLATEIDREFGRASV